MTNFSTCSTSSITEDAKTSSSSSSKRKSVSFGNVSCRLYNRTVGVHPGVSSGPALDFSWTYTSTEDITVDDYENSFNEKERRSKLCLLIPRFERVEILRKDCNVSKSTIASHIRMITKTKKQRKQTLTNMKYEPIEEKLESCISVMRRLRIRRKTSVTLV